MIDLENKAIKLKIYDTSGQERFAKITGSYYKVAHGIILSYDVSDEKSFKNILTWVNEMMQHAEKTSAWS